MTVTRIDLDDDALERAMTLSKAKTTNEVVNLALRFYADKQERAAHITRHFDRARGWAQWAMRRAGMTRRRPSDVSAGNLRVGPPAQYSRHRLTCAAIRCVEWFTPAARVCPQFI